MNDRYVHGYCAPENERLRDQATTLFDLLHHDTTFAPGSTVLEAGCGVGAQMVLLAQRHPEVNFVAVDLAAPSVQEARRRIADAGLRNVSVQQGDIFSLPFSPRSFDHMLVCFVLEHLQQPGRALQQLRQLLKEQGTLISIEGDHGSTQFHPDSAAARAAIQCQVELQRRGGGDALIGRRLYPLLASSGFHDVRVSPRLVYVDASRQEWVDGFIRKTFIAMIAGVRESALAAQLSTAESFDAAIRDLECTTADDGTFCYTFFKATARR